MKIYLRAFLVIVMPPLLLTMILATFMMNDMQHALKQIRYYGFDTGFLYRIIPSYLGLILALSISFLLQSLLSFKLILFYEDREDPSLITTGELWQEIKADLGYMIASYFSLFFIMLFVMIACAGLIAMVFVASKALGVILIIIAFFLLIYFSIPLNTFYLIRLRERLGVFESISRCFKLVKGNWWRTFGIIMIMSMASLALRTMVSAPFASADLVTTIRQIQEHRVDPDAMQTSNGISQAVSIAASVLFAFLVTVGTAVNYYTQVESTDHIGLMGEIESIGEKPDPEYKQDGEY
jgi:hypothetical protein